MVVSNSTDGVSGTAKWAEMINLYPGETVYYSIERLLLSSLGINPYPVTCWMTPYSQEYGANMEAQH